jgi:hypothetical protein
MRPNPKHAGVLVVAGVLTLLLWLCPPIASTRQIPVSAMLPAFGPAYREEIRSYHEWIWNLRSHQEIWFEVLIPRTVGVWMASLVTMEALRRTRIRPVGGESSRP